MSWPPEIVDAVMLSLAESLDDAMQERRCRCGATHVPAPDCYLSPDVMAAIRALADEDEP